MSMDHAPRKALVLARREALLELAQRLGAGPVYLVGSVARSEEHEIDVRHGTPSDIDFYTPDFRRTVDEGADRQRERELVAGFQDLLWPYDVDIRPLPTYFLDAAFEATMKRDARLLSMLV